MPQYTQTALEEELRRAERLPVGWPWRLLLFSIIVFGATIAGYLGITLGYKPYLNSQIKTLDSKVANLTQTVGEEQQKNLVSLYSQLTNIQNLLNSHVAASKVFDLLEKNTQPQVYYLSLNFSLAGRDMQLDGSAPNYGVLAQQLEVFKQIPEIEKISLGDSVVVDDGTVHFSLRLIFKPAFVNL